ADRVWIVSFPALTLIVLLLTRCTAADGGGSRMELVPLTLRRAPRVPLTPLPCSVMNSPLTVMLPCSSSVAPLNTFVEIAGLPNAEPLRMFKTPASTVVVAKYVLAAVRTRVPAACLERDVNGEVPLMTPLTVRVTPGTAEKAILGKTLLLDEPASCSGR